MKAGYECCHHYYQAGIHNLYLIVFSQIHMRMRLGFNALRFVCIFIERAGYLIICLVLAGTSSL